ncbi:lytic transglycosylase domain-containing protein [Pelistega ratti]|uniref:lytic transglycosylase domain-containing protein n=1 Tax=Pelistega ratti TaxID=2652177 RepID=UPI00135A751C|nr:lytic transglycosylase domain-containing protein [Pelistega ratti]
MQKKLVKGLYLSIFGLLLGCSSSNKSTVHASTELGTTHQASPINAKHPIEYKPIQSVDMAARQSVIQAYQAMKNRQWDLLPNYAIAAQNDHELGAYPMYWYLRQQLSQTNIPVTLLQSFFKQYPNTYVSARLKADWVVAAAKQGDFRTAVQLGKPTINHASGICAYYQAKAALGQSVSISEALASAKNNDACGAMLNTLKSKGLVDLHKLREPLREAVEYDNKAMAQRYARVAFTTEGFQQFNAIINNPKQWLDTQFGPAKNIEQAELRTLAFSRLARQDRENGIHFLKTQGAALLSAKDQQWAYTQFALVSVLNLEDRADQWYRLGKDIQLSPYNAAWRVRAALRQPKIDWAWVEKAINLMDSTQQKETVWTYWKARALKERGHTAQANALFAQLEGQYDFYGLLGQEALHGHITFPTQAAPVSTAELNHIKQNTGLQKAVALFSLGWRNEAVAEWNYAIVGLGDRDLLAAAQWAENEHIYDRAINTSMLTKREVNFHQRFLAPFEGRVGQQARSVGIAPSWVYGLIRQESRFVSVARSTVGASGLMQLMPGTAKLVANKIGMSDFSPSRVNDFEVNTILGTNYLSMIQADLDGKEVLATAGYNAGPNRAKRWRSALTHPVEGAIFAETIPFTETRIYVKNVLANAVWYDALFNKGKVKSLKNRLGTIAP